MAVITWDHSLSVGIAEIDRQHKKLINIINELNEAMMARKSKESLGKILNELVNYTGTHFLTEEKLFDQHGYPETLTHKKKHEEFVNKAYDFKDKFEAGKLGISISLMTFLGDWLREHIKGTDQKYSAFFKEKGVS